MRTAIVFYSMSGNTEFISNIIKKKLKADTIQIEPSKLYPDSGLKKFFWGGRSAMMGEAPELVPYDFNLANYDRIIIGTPVWAGTFVPPIRTFLQENDISGKKVAAYACYSGRGAEKALDKLKKFIGIDAFEAEMTLVDPMIKLSDKNDEAINEFCEKLING